MIALLLVDWQRLLITLLIILFIVVGLLVWALAQRNEADDDAKD